PVSNISLSLGEDALAIFLTWFATQHPVLASLIVLAFLVAIGVTIRWVIRALRSMFRSAEAELAA
ncbi:MAG: DUF4126 domain-containing protein, partial [Candidatus Koribacter versatilis]|nr:DUF4126 domain-containing protein [Candidatus Koribacter versatilis]